MSTSIDITNIENIIEACLLTAAEPISLQQLSAVFDSAVNDEILLQIINKLKAHYSNRGLELIELIGGYRFRSKIELQPYLNKLYQLKPPRYSRAIMETLAIIAYRQPVTRGEIEEIRGVSINSSAVQALLDRGWIEAIGHKQIPGRPELLATTTKFLEEFGITSLQDLPPLPHIDTSQFSEKNDLIEEYNKSSTSPSALSETSLTQ